VPSFILKITEKEMFDDTKWKKSIQWQLRKPTKGQAVIYKILHRKLRSNITRPNKCLGKLKCPEIQ
jgi:hypothetical protein